MVDKFFTFMRAIIVTFFFFPLLVQADDKSILGLDVRSFHERQSTPAPGSLHIPLDQLEENEKSLVGNKNKKIYVFCESGRRSSRAQKILFKMGYEKVENIGSWRDWNRMQKDIAKKSKLCSQEPC